MTPLELRITLGQEDERLPEIISLLERMKAKQDVGCGISDVEQRTLDLAWARLEVITSTPK